MSDTITPRWLSVAAACRYSGCCEKLLLGRLRDRLIVVRLPDTKKLRICRYSIDELMLENAEGAKARAIVDKML